MRSNSNLSTSPAYPSQVFFYLNKAITILLLLKTITLGQDEGNLYAGGLTQPEPILYSRMYLSQASAPGSAAADGLTVPENGLMRRAKNGSGDGVQGGDLPPPPDVR